MMQLLLLAVLIGGGTVLFGPWFIPVAVLLWAFSLG
jgi:hypothetical protein